MVSSQGSNQTPPTKVVAMNVPVNSEATGSVSKRKVNGIKSNTNYTQILVP